jgi:Plavaka transposase
VYFKIYCTFKIIFNIFKNIFIYRWKTLSKMVLEPLYQVKPLTRSYYFPLPRGMFGDSLSTYEQRMNAPLLGAQGTVTDLFQVVASMLLEQDLVGKDLEDYNFTYTPLIDGNGDQMYGGITSARNFREAEKEVKRKWGQDTCLLVVNFSSDKTHVTRCGTVVLCPVYATIANFSVDNIRRPSGNDIVGYCPLSPYTQVELDTILRESGNRADFDTQHKMIKLFLEMKFFDKVLEGIKKQEETGPIVLQYGRSPWKHVERRTMIQAGIYSGNVMLISYSLINKYVLYIYINVVYIFIYVVYILKHNSIYIF